MQYYSTHRIAISDDNYIIYYYTPCLVRLPAFKSTTNSFIVPHTVRDQYFLLYFTISRPLKIPYCEVGLSLAQTAEKTRYYINNYIVVNKM